MYTFKLRRASASEWLAENPVLSDGEPGFERDTGKLKIGNGISEWTSLDYFVPADPTSNASLPDHILSELPHPVYDNGASFTLLYENAKV
jgi:hypothetical protein